MVFLSRTNIITSPLTRSLRPTTKTVSLESTGRTFGFHPAAADFDERVVALVRENRLGDALSLEAIVEDAKADSLWQLAMLHGALGDAFEGELLSYDRPTYFGMLCAAYRHRG